MKNLLLILLTIGILQSCETKSGSGNIVKRDKTLSSFNKLRAGSGMEVVVNQGSDYKITIHADDNIIDDIEVEVSGGELSLGYRDGISVNDADVKITVEVPSLYSVEASSAADIKLNGVWSANKEFILGASSAGSVTAEIDAPATSMEASSSGRLIIKGRTKNFRAEASSAGSIEAQELLSENARAEVSSGSSIQLHASQQLTGDASSGGSIRYRGNPSVSKDESSGGSVSKMD